jgi:opacity protein-like surface antigen
MIIARTRVWALAVAAPCAAARSFRIDLAICAALTVWATERAGAADWPLRGSLAPQPTYVRWDGWQVGVEAGWGNFRNDFGNSTSPLVAFILRNTLAESEFSPSSWTTLPSNTTNGPVFGGYIGYNMQWDQLVLGVDLGYKYANISTGATDSISRQFTTSSQFQETVSIVASTTGLLLRCNIPAHRFHLRQASLSISPTPRATARPTPLSAAWRPALA